MNRMLSLRWLRSSRWSLRGAQAQVTGKTVLTDNANAWIPGTAFPGSEWSVQTGSFHAGGVGGLRRLPRDAQREQRTRPRSTQVAPWTDRSRVPAPGSDQSSTCLLCHGDTAAALPTTPYVIANTGARAAPLHELLAGR